VDNQEFFGKISRTVRTVLLAILMASLTFASVVRLLQIQIADTYGFFAEREQFTRTISQPIQAVRGQIADRTGLLLNSNEIVYKVILQRAFLPLKNENEIIAGVLEVLMRHEHEWLDSMPITFEQPFQFKNVPHEELDGFKHDLGLNYDATVENAISALADNFNIDVSRFSEDQQQQMLRYIGGVRYEMYKRDFSFQNRYVLAEDISMEVIIELREMQVVLPGVDIIQEPIRVYHHGEILPHIRGQIGAISAEQYAVLHDSGYSLNDTIGLFGIEESMESILRGENGIFEITRNNLWEVVSATTTREAHAGNSVKLTIDGDFQRMAVEILKNHLDHNNRNSGNRAIQRYSTPDGASGGSMAVMCVPTGAILALATYPSFDLNDYVDLLLAENSGETPIPHHPLRNRALEGTRPGSTYKTLTAAIALMEGVITGSTRVFCGGRWHLFNNPHCWNRRGCGARSTANALSHSCNIFFYETSRLLGQETFAQQSIDIFGVGTDLQIGVAMDAGRMTTPEMYQALHGMPLHGAALAQAAIGQSETLMTPLHLASAAAMVANGGVRLRPHLVHSVWNYDFTKLIYETEPVVELDVRRGNEYAFRVTQDGLRDQGWRTHRDFGVFAHLTDGNLAAYKTGTPEIAGNRHNSSVMGYYPADNPQIAFAIIAEGGDRVNRSIRNIINAYFYGEFEPLPDDARSTIFHVPWTEPRTPLPNRYNGVFNPWIDWTPDDENSNEIVETDENIIA